MKLALLLFLSLGVTCASRNQTETTENDQTNDIKTPEEAQVGETRTSKVETPLVGSPTHGPESTTSNFRQGMPDFDDLIDLGRNLNAKNLSALETLNAFESLEALGETLNFLKAIGAPGTPKALKEALEALGNNQFPKACGLLDVLEPSEALGILKDLETLKYLESPEMLKAALKEALETNPKLSIIPEFLNALADLRAFDSFADLDAALNFLKAIRHGKGLRFIEATKDTFKLPEALNFRKARESLRFFESPEAVEAFNALKTYKNDLESLKAFVKGSEFLKSFKSPKAPKDLESHESANTPESSEILKAYTEALEFIKSYKKALESPDPSASPNALKSPEALGALESLEALKALKALDSPEAHKAFEFLKVFDSPEAFKAFESPEALRAFEFVKTLENVLEALEAPEALEALGEALDFLNARKASDSQKARESLEALDSLLARRRALAGDNPDLVAEHKTTASIIMTDCPALKDAETTVQSALKNQYYEVLRCLQRHTIWKDKSQELWYWAMIYGTPAWDMDAFDKQKLCSFKEMFFKLDDTELFERVRHEPYFKDISEDDICKNIIKFDSVNILTNLYPTMVKEIAENIDLVIIDYSPARIISQLIPPHAVKSAGQLQRLFDAGYDQIPKLCLRLKNGGPTIHTDCAEWLAKHNCLLLFEEMFQHNPDFKYDYYRLYRCVIDAGSLDVAKWLHDTNRVQCPDKDSTETATREGHLEVIKWIVAEFRDQIDWKSVIEETYSSWCSHKVVEYIESKVNVTLEPEIALYRLAAKGDLTGLQTALSELPDNFPWQYVANGAARGGHADIVQWVDKESPKILPESDAIEDACNMGDFSVLTKVYEIVSTRVVPEYEYGKIDAMKCFLYAAMHKNSEAMGWILNNPLNDKLLNAKDMYFYNSNVPEEAYIRAFEMIAKANGCAVVDQEMMLHAARLGHVKVFQWLREQGLAITTRVTMGAAFRCKVEILKATHAIDPLLVCTVDVANAAVKFIEIWKFNVLDWMHKTCKILPTDLSNKKVKEWVEERQQK